VFTLYKTDLDPYTVDDGATYECVDCGSRFGSDSRAGACPDCGDGRVRNISVCRE
jgi:Zn finger protein HypA/HybF involved in hydrogenase expression